MDQEILNQPNNPEQPFPPSQTSATHWLRTLSIILLAVFLLSTVGLGTYFLGKNQTNQPQIAQSSSTPVSDSTANWKTYSIGGQYEFEYPLDKFSIEPGQANLSYVWPGEVIVRPNDSYISQSSGDTSPLSISARENKDNLTLNDTSKLLGFDPSTFSGPPKITQRQVVVSGLNGIRFDNLGAQSGYTTKVFVIKPTDKIYQNGLIYQFVISNGPANDDPRRPLAEKILSTFKFTN